MVEELAQWEVARLVQEGVLCGPCPNGWKVALWVIVLAEDPCH